MVKSQVKVCVSSLSRVPLFVTPWTVAYEAPSSMGFSWQEYWSGLPFPSQAINFGMLEVFGDSGEKLGNDVRFSGMGSS